MNHPFISIALGSLTSIEKIVTIIPYGSSPTRELREGVRKQGKLADATECKKTRSLIKTTSDHVVLCAVVPSTPAQILGLKLKRAEELRDEKR
jgi:regulator of extracellular matrix RemA (YlzA/DUF370 family)